MSENEGVDAEVTVEDDGAAAADAQSPTDGATPDETLEPDAELVDRLADQPPEQVAREVAALRERVETLEADLDAERETVEELESKLKRKQADFQNFKKRQQKKLEDQQRRATEDLVERLLEVRDNLVRALEQDEGADIRGGIETTLRQFDQVLDAEDVEAIEPEPGTEVDPVRHEVLMRVESDEDEGTVADIHRPGYEMAGKVLRPAQVTVADDE
ncbi:nucleotide exchange factor GrpE [Halorarius litoreus]|uniref:nucleotide exchange factor GrpE n=1 Tax=Halorarius litoreus TaxID=2962676 RepID=UPI0020CC20C9|nr:nucleotide exchange factor GrpE [Halorarius litoreus]